MNNKKILSLMLICALAISLGIGATAASAASGTSARGSKGEIDVYLIAGQSNAVGYGSGGLSTSIMNDPRYTNGFDNVLYYGVAEDSVKNEFVPVTVGLGKDSSRVGAEVGIAAAVCDSTRQSAIIKHAIGGSYLYPTTNGTPAQNYGTWTPPSYIEKYGISTGNNKIGDIYEAFLQTVTNGIGMLVSEGYTPVIKGIFWMQGEAETPDEAPSKAYKELLTMLISEMRRDVSNIAYGNATSCDDIPFIMGKITRNPSNDVQPPYVDVVNAAQSAVIAEISGTYILDTTGLAQVDGWHFSADSQHWIGRQIVSIITAAEGKHSVTLSGANAAMTGGGAKSTGDTVTVTVTPYEDCIISSVKIKIGASEAVAIELDASGCYTFTMPDDNVVIIVDANDPGAVETPYGTIPSRFTDAEKYAFVLFKGGIMINAFEDWHTFVNGNTLTGCTLLLRRDYSTTEGGDAWGLVNISDLTLDLGGYTLTRGDNHLFQALGKGSAAHSTTLRVINGTLKAQFYKDTPNSSGNKVGATPLIVFNNEATSTASDYFEFIFDNVTFDVSEGRGILVCYDNGTVGSKSKILLNGCTIYRGAKTNSMTLFAMTDADNKNDVEIIINDGKLVADSLAGLTFATYNDPVAEGKGSNDTLKLGSGKFTVVLPQGYDVGNAKFTFTDGGYSPMDPVTNADGTVSYTLANLATPYGDIEPQYLSVEDYPFALFKNGKMIYAFKDWKSFIDSSAYKTADYQTGCTLLLRRDYSTSEASGSCWAISYIKDLVIDLGTNTLTRGNYHLFNVISHGASENTTAITVINGTLKGNFYKDGTTSAIPALLTFNNDSNSTSTDTFVFNFNGITFDLSAGRGLIQSSANSTYKTGKTVSVVNFNNCEFLRGNITNKTTLFNLYNAANRNDIAVTLNGCRLVAGKTEGIANLTLADFNEGSPSPDSLTVIGKFEVILPADAAAPTLEYNLTGGSYFLMKRSVNSDSTATYTLEDLSVLNTPYGRISVENASVADYPFVLFKNGEMIHAFRDWQVFVDTEMRVNAAYQSGCTLLLRRDYSTTETAKNCWALAWMRDIVIDLGGYTLTRGDTHLFNAISHGAENTTTVITVINGTVRADLLKSDGKPTGPAICFNNDSKSTSTDTYVFNFNSVTFDVSTGRGLIASYNDGTDTSRVRATVNYNNCTFYRGSKTGELVLFALDDASSRNDVEVVISGGCLVSDKTLEGIVFATFNAPADGGTSPDRLVLTNNGEGKYFTVTAPDGAGEILGSFELDDGSECVFVRAEDGYKIYPKVLVGYNIKTSVALYSDFVYNIYIPTVGFVRATVNGEEVQMQLTEMDGESYYLIRVELASGMPLSDISVSVTLASGSKELYVTQTHSVLEYARAVINGEHGAAGVALMKDMLVYARSTYTYFGNELDSEKAAQIAALLAGYEGQMQAGEAKKPTDATGLSGVAVYMDKGAPRLRFYLARGYSADDFTFTVGGKDAATVAGEGYVDVITYAYMLLDDVSYTVTDKKTSVAVTEVYNVYSYLEYVKTLNDTSLTDLVESLIRYAQSARIYNSGK